MNASFKLTVMIGLNCLRNTNERSEFLADEQIKNNEHIYKPQGLIPKPNLYLLCGRSVSGPKMATARYWTAD